MKLVNFNRFQRDEEGAITLFIIGMFLLMVVAGGMAVDFMRHESERVRFQDSMDRGVLTAASLKQVDQFGVEYQDPKDVVTSYLRADGYDVDSPDMAIAVRTPASNNASSRQVDAAAEYSINTFFLRLVRIPTMTVAAYSSAAVEYSQVELSLVVDVSYSMTLDAAGKNSGDWDFTHPRLDDLKVAATDFVNQVITDENVDRTTMSIIPFSAQVNPGAQIAEEFANLNRWHDYSPCFDFARPGDPTSSGNDFLTTAMAPSDSFQLGQHWKFNFNGGEKQWCLEDNNQIVALTNNRDLLTHTISNIEAELYTAQWMGVKWGAALLDPAFQPITNALTSKTISIPVFDVNGNATATMHNVPTVENIFRTRPAEFGGTTNKYLVLMSDGDNTLHSQITPAIYNQTSTSVWRSQANADWWNGQASNYTQHGWVYVRPCSWCNRTWVLQNTNKSGPDTPTPEHSISRNSFLLDRNAQDLDSSFHIGPSESDQVMDQICTAAKADEHIHIYTIGFAINAPNVPEGQVLTPNEVDNLSTSSYQAYKALYRCATNGADFFHVADAAELAAAFEKIASNVARLKLVD